ncbi:MAG TPA: cytochrome o ubiquinol oxidase subunit III [Spirochaetia bacterium]|nr:cytochrome o ubiquinol oxidase subunit III [Spirochaetia bacterium]
MNEQAVNNRVLRDGADGQHDPASIRLFGFWVYLMSDCILFASLFVTFAVLHTSYAGGPTGKDIFALPGVLVETICLLTSSFTCGLANVAMKRGVRTGVMGWLAATFLLGAAFVCLEASEFGRLILEGSGPGRSAFLSAFFTLVSTHGLHVTCGLLWMAVLVVRIARKGLNAVTSTRFMMLSLFWHFLDIVWICVFTFVYLIGVL